MTSETSKTAMTSRTFAEKLLTVPPPIEVAGRRIKRYHVTTDPAGIAPDVQEAAYAMLPKLLPEAGGRSRWGAPTPAKAPGSGANQDGTPPATFVVLHRGADDGAYLNAYSWVWDNVLHFMGAAAGQPVLGCPDRDPTHFIAPDLPWIGCVWELPPILHERDAWVRHMLAPDAPDLDAYMADCLPEGTTGDRS
ncbi:hypothetical protein [Streptomyces sp. NPDC050988]|uniref:hypothetical protein n=1 Tax=Streptomyces sp. NPDC050988 TaxID=3365637 RepID=UPI0037BD25DE